jgi:penicillin-insensitive murein endopeptidase
VRRAALLLALALGSAACVGKGLLTDGSSVSMGRADRGVLRGGRALPLAGPGFVVPPEWAGRGTQYGTDELVGAIERAAARVSDEHPGALLGVGDLSRRGGGDMSFHRSHESGRDADLLFYSVDDEGEPLAPPDAMPRYRGRHLRAHEPYEDRGNWKSPTGRRLDLERTWALVRALLSDPSIDVEYLFVSEKIEDKLIDWAKEQGEEEALVKRAQVALRQPAGLPPHDDHLHLRIRCPSGDRFQGCVDEGPVRLRVLDLVRPTVTLK